MRPIIAASARYGAVAMLAIATACNSDDGQQVGHASVTVPHGADPSAVRARARLADMNTYAWIGQAHNAGLRELKRQIAPPGTPASLCRFIANFAAQPERIPRERLPHGEHDVQRIRTNLEQQLCGKAQGARIATRRTAYAPAVSQEYPISAAAIQLLGDVENSITYATDSYDLALRLLPILDAAATLGDTAGRAAVEVAVSIAQSSVENAETELSSYVGLIEAEYGACADTYRSAGYGSEDAFYACTEQKNETYETLNRFIARTPLRLTAVETPALAPRCVGLGNGWKRVGKADVKGAIGGFFGGLATTKSLAGAGVAALGGSVGASGAEYVHVAFDMWWCLM